MQKQSRFGFLYLIRFIHFYHALQTCGRDNRRIFTSDHGTVSNGPWLHNYSKVRERCEYLIKGKPGETITLNFHVFRTECMYDHVFVHDGASRSSKFLAVLSGKKDGTVTVSNTHQVFIILHTDNDDPSGSGFNLTYTINKCPNGCSGQGKCNDDHTCKCFVNRYGEACQYESCPEFQGVHCSNTSWCNATSKLCTCGPGFYGGACSLSEGCNKNLNTWHNITVFSDIFKSRAGHVSAYIEGLNILVVHGGYSFNKIYDDTVFYNFSSSVWSAANIVGNNKPSSRFDHAGVSYKDSFIIFGGELGNGSYTNELWLFNCSTNTWHLLDSSHRFGWKLHTITLVDESLYIFGGQSSQFLISSKIYIYNLVKKSWKNPTLVYGNEIHLRVYGHSTIFYEDLKSLVVFGGFHSKVSLKKSELTNQMLLYNIEKNVWSVVSDLADINAPRPLAYHTSAVIGNYMIIFGGLVEPPADSYFCPLSSKFYYYNLHCGTWVSQEALSKQYKSSKKDPAFPNVRFSHTAIIKNRQTLIITGGYDHSTILNDVVAYQLPKSVFYIQASSGMELHGTHCALYTHKKWCVEDPSCAYCSSGCVAFGKAPSDCDNTCKGICKHFHSCETCTAQTIFDKRKQDKEQGEDYCSWCTLDRTCYSNQNSEQMCKIGTDLKSKCKITEGDRGTASWWDSNNGKKIDDMRDCQLYDNRTGMKMLQYANKPYKENYPDGVKILKSAADISSMLNVLLKHTTDKQRIVIIGIVYPYFCYSNDEESHHAIQIHGVRSSGELYISDFKWNTSLQQNSKPVTKFSSSNVVTIKDDARRGGLFPVPSGSGFSKQKLNYILNLTADVRRTKTGPVTSLNFLWAHSDQKFDPIDQIIFADISANYLQLYYRGDCSNYTSCMWCITDSFCGWNHLKSNCLLLSDWWNDYDERDYLAREESQCVKCVDYFDCRTCLRNSHCVWTNYAGCKRSDQQIAAFVTTNIDKCSATCEHFDVSECIKHGFGCLWCSRKSICISMSDYHLNNHLAQCYTFEVTERKLCSESRNCSTCMQNFKCGWVFNITDPRIGFCNEGDFAGPTYSNMTDWAYEKCPDIDECSLGIDKCKNNSRCANVYGSYECPCNQGFEGDGKIGCTKMCWPKCVQGNCTKELKCKCYLGWKGVNCSTDCGCYNHSTCFNDTSPCDKCQHFTRGEHCEHCVNGSYGDATVFGCKKCQCNHHGDPARNICDMTDGTCYCLNNTAGKNCEKCLPNFSHAPKEYSHMFPGPVCHLNCNRANIHFVNSSGWLVASRDKYTSPFITCLWILTGRKLSHHALIFNQTKLDKSILLRLHVLKSNCSESHLNIYDGVPPNPRMTGNNFNSNFKLLNSVCSLNSNNKVYRSETGVLSLLYEGRTHHKKDDLPYNGEPVNEFLGEYSLLSCPDECPAPFKCTPDMRCVCEYGHYGPLCEHEVCKNNCSSSDGGGTCDLTSSKCQCNHGFYGEDCSKIISGHHFSIEHIHATYMNMSKYKLERLASTMVLHGHTLYVFGGSHFYDFDRPLFVQFDISTNEWKSIEFPGSLPSHRFAHCSFVYNQHVYIYGGIGKEGFLNDMWKFSLVRREWEEIKFTTNLSVLAGHSCTLAGGYVYIFGGYIPGVGLNEFHSIQLDLHGDLETWIYMKFTELEHKPKPMYGHVAVYDEANNYIYFHGGMMHYEEKIQLSNLIHVYHVKTRIWNYLEKQTNEISPSLVGHTGQLINNTMYLFGGYTDHFSFNEHVYVWKVKCNKWYTLRTIDKGLEGDGRTDQMFLNSVRFNDSIFIFGGFNSDVSSNINVFSVPSNLCGRHTSNEECSEDDCYWCQVANHSVCFSHAVPSRCNNNQATITYDNKCKKENTLLRKCNTFTSCLSCLSSHPYRRTKCHWCRCLRDSGKCYGEDDECECKRHSTLNKCYEVFCEGSSCRNCKGNCIWTNYLRYKSESRRILNRYGLEFNCFLRGLYVHLPHHATVFDHRACPLNCNTYQDCRTCLHHNAFGIDGGTRHCIWSDKLSECLSPPVLTLRCSFGLCGQLYVQNMLSECPAPCSTKKSCWKCTKTIGCGWCEITGSNTGSCIKGDLRGSYSNNCSYNNVGPQSMDVYSTSYTWAYFSCPLKDECSSGIDTCNDETELCHDEVDGFSCLCKEGYKKASNVCKPVCHGCVHGDCLKPDDCNCSFGWTGKNCTVECECNGHSRCINESTKDICIKCNQNTQGKNCSECKRYFVGNPINNGSCQSCKSYCNNNAEICVTKEQYDMVKRNHSMELITKGPIHDAVCINCTHYSFGSKCDDCVTGYFRMQYGTRSCVKCKCNGHSYTCDTLTGLNCNCSHNTVTPASEKKKAFQANQCSRCKIGYIGNPTEGSQCFGILSRNVGTRIKMKSEGTAFLYITPNFSNVNLRITLDVYDGEVDAYLTSAVNTPDAGNIFKMREENNPQHTQTLNLTKKVDINISSIGYSMLTRYNHTNSVLLIKGVRHRLVIHIPHKLHDFSQSKFYIALSSINKTQGQAVHGMLYFCQDQPKLNLVLFFLTLIIILMLILSGFILGWKVRAEYVRQRGENRQDILLQRMQMRPFASYKIRCERNEDIDIIRKRKNRDNLGRNKISNGGRQNNNNSDKKITPLLLQNTENCLASVITVMVQFPENEFSLWNLSLASGIFQSNAQQVPLHIKTSNLIRGTKVNTRFLNTHL